MNACLGIVEKYVSRRAAQARHSRRADDLPDAQLGAAELFEAFLLLSLSTQTGNVKPDEFQSLQCDIFEPFFFELWAGGAGNNPDVPSYVAHSEESHILILRFQRFQRTIERAMLGELEPPSVSLNDPSKFARFVAECLSIYASMVQDEGLRSLDRIVQYSPDTEWNLIATGETTPLAIVSVADDETSDQTATIYYGLLRLLGYWDQLRNVAGEITKDKEIDFGSATRFKDRLVDIFAWRMRMPSHESTRRMELIRNNLSRQIRYETDDQNVAILFVKGFGQAFDAAFGLVIEPNPKPKPRPSPVLVY
jgi:hypothetical protein